MTNPAVNTAQAVQQYNEASQAVNTAQEAVKVQCIILTIDPLVRTKNYSDGKTGEHVYQNVEITTKGPLQGMVFIASRTTLNKAGITGEPMAIGSEAVVYLREAKKSDGTPIVFGDLGSGNGSTDIATQVSALHAFRNMGQSA